MNVFLLFWTTREVEFVVGNINQRSQMTMVRTKKIAIVVTAQLILIPIIRINSNFDKKRKRNLDVSTLNIILQKLYGV